MDHIYGPYHMVHMVWFISVPFFVVERSWKNKLLDHFEIFDPCPENALAWKFRVRENLLDCALLQRDFQKMLFQLENNNFQNKYLQ